MEKKLRTPDTDKKHKKGRLSALLVVALVAMAALIVGLGTIVFSQSSESKNPRAKTATAAPAKTDKTYVATKEIIFDQASGKLRKPTAAETQQLVAQISSLTNRTTDGLTARTLPNGTKQISLEGRFGGVVLGRAREDGSTEIRCVTTMEEAVAFLGLEAASGPQGQ
jgi:uncharacterized protein HemX